MPAPRVNGHINGNHGLRRQAIVASVLSEVFRGRLRPGEHLVSRELEERFGVSQTPVREAMIALSGIGVVDLVPNRGAVVRRVSCTEVHDICQVRRVLECEATRLACGRIELAELNELAAAFRKLQTIRPSGHKAQKKFIEHARQLDSRLHDLIADSCGNAFLAKEIGRLKILFRACRDVAWERDEARNDWRRLSEEAHEHLAIVQALQANDPKEAARAMSRHIRSGAKYWSRSVPGGRQSSNGSS